MASESIAHSAYWEGNLMQILCGDWLPKRTRWSHVTCLGFPALVPQAKCSYCGHNMATKRALVFTENGWISVHKMAGAYYCTKWIRAVKLHHKEHDNDPYPLHKNAINYFLCIYRQAVDYGIWICTGSYRGLGGEWVNMLIFFDLL